MITVPSDPQIVLHQPASLPALRAADQGVAAALDRQLWIQTLTGRRLSSVSQSIKRKPGILDGKSSETFPARNLNTNST